MITVEQVFADFFRREGWPTVTDHPADRGGLTKGGVTLRSFNGWRVAGQARPLTRDEFALITIEEAQAFLRDEFLQPLAFMEDEGIFALMADWAMHAGLAAPVRALQGLLIGRGLYDGALDGIPGPKTRAGWARVRADLAACAEIERSLAKGRVLDAVTLALDARARAFMREQPTTQLVFLRGWVTRALEFL